MTETYDVEFVERDDRSARFLVRGLTPAFANGIRRAMVADVPTMAIDEVRFIENSSVMFDEQLALRLGLVPLTTPPEGEFVEDDTVTLSIDVEGPATAYSGDLVTSDDLVRPADENVPIIDLKDGQRLEAEADAVIDRGKDHAKHQGGVAVGYRHLQRVTVEDDLSEFEDEETQIVRGVIEDDGELVPTSEFGHDLSERYPGKQIRVEDVPGAFVFHVETDGSFDVEELVTRAVDSIDRRAAELEEAVQL
ncbi:DNA-directed RNA polymerase subunit D [Natronosalvus halobius]|uniref:DNA-directed RNA polymerase subunit D n=1 Tax=Natronosalvus halobius TaxID=2953746 RepID=UPI00209FE251|nr:DNA-directed RNA polymerase subunit D [Natronosalvus halobius]USZ71851.1 DNA-directed RNA polymerase subunit D [Natronosalvus halobius]